MPTKTLFVLSFGFHRARSQSSYIDFLVPSSANAPLELVVDNILLEEQEMILNDVVESAAPAVDLSSCRVFLAPSTIPGAGMGIFAGRAFQRGDEVTPSDAVVPLIDMHWHNDVSEFVNDFLWDEYTWSADTFPGMSEPGIQHEAASFGIGALPNCFFPRLNVHDSEASRDNAGIDPGFDPGSGAFTVFHNRRGIASKDIEAGEEIFVDYGYGYFEGDREYTYGLMPFLYSYERADRLLKSFRKTTTKINARMSLIKRWGNRLDWDENAFNDALYQLLQSVIMIWPSRTQGALPVSVDGVNHVLDQLGSTSFIHDNRSRRDLDLLIKHGSCLDHLVAGTSNIPSAGRGAFANKFLPKGTNIATIPLIHIPDREVFSMFSGFIVPNSKEVTYQRNVSKKVHHQLMLNYCFGHRSSSLLLCPYGIVSSLVNHGSSKSNRANAKVVWSSKSTSKPEWFNMSLDDWAYSYQSGLAFDYIALRDIEEGEEVLIDYGDEWQDAWDKHITTWTPKPRTSQILNDADPQLEIPLYSEWPWPATQLWCRNQYREFQGLSDDDDSDYGYPCRVVMKTVDQETREILYIVEIIALYHGTKTEQTEEFYLQKMCGIKFEEVWFNLPRDAFSFGNSFDPEDRNRYYTESWSFRHDIRIPDNLLPPKWKTWSS